MATWVEYIFEAYTNLGGLAAHSELYKELSRIRGKKLTKTQEATVRKEIERFSSDSQNWEGRKDLFYSVHGLGRGVWGVRDLILVTPIASDIGDSSSPERIETKTYRVLRDTALARRIKRLHQDKCQIYGVTIRLSDGKTYSEAHHLHPLGKPHNGPDTAENILVLCPNHHVMCDYGIIELVFENLTKHPNHEIGRAHLKYHNTKILHA